MSKIAICVPIHLRGESADHLAPAMKGLHLLRVPVLLCGSEGDHSRKELAKYCKGKIAYLEVPQGPVCTDSSGDAVLRAKFNDCMKALRDAFPEQDWYCLVGANDVVSPIFWNALKSRSPKAPSLYGVASGCPLYLSKGDALWRCWLNYDVELLPGAQAWNAPALNLLAGEPYCQPGCEVGAEGTAKALRINIIGLYGAVWSIKDGTNLNTVEHIAKHHKLEEMTFAEGIRFNELFWPVWPG